MANQILQILHSGGHGALDAHAHLIMDGVHQQPLLAEVIHVGEHAVIEDLALRLDALLQIEGGQLRQELAGVLKQAHGAPVERAGVKGAHFDAGHLTVVGHAVLIGGGMLFGGAGGGAVDDHVAVLVSADQRDRLTELLLIHAAQTVVCTHVQVNDGGAQLPTVIGVLRDLLGRLGDLVAGGGDSAGQRRSNDRLCHKMYILSHFSRAPRREHGMKYR